MKTLHNDPPECSNDVLAMRDTLETLGGKWKLLILHYLITRADEENTFKKIEREVIGISAKVLTQALKELEANQLIIRTVRNTKPVTTLYTITPYGTSVAPIIKTLVDWGTLHRVQLLATIEA